MNAINKTGKIFLPVYCVSFMTPEVGARKEARLADARGFSQKNLEELHSRCVTLIQDAATSDRLSKEPHLGMLLFRWLQWGREEDVREWVKELVKTDDGLLDFLIGFVTQVYSTSGNYKVVRRSTIGKLIDVSIVEERARQVNQCKRDELNSQQKEAIDTFLSEQIDPLSEDAFESPAENTTG